MSYFIDGRCLGCGGSMQTDGSCSGNCGRAGHTEPVNIPSVFRMLTADERIAAALERIADALERGGANDSHTHGYGRCMPVPQSPHGA